jgi:hypothetical protein
MNTAKSEVASMLETLPDNRVIYRVEADRILIAAVI